MKPIPIFVGYDVREPSAYHVFCNSVIRHASIPVAFIPLAENLVPIDGRRDGSNSFIYSRFLVPHMMGFNGFALFMDGDMLVRDDIAKLWEMRNPHMDAQVVKHDYKTKFPVKYLGASNEDYPRKNWSSVILWNCTNYPNRVLTPEYLDKATGVHLHRFEWLDDERIGDLPPEWNHLVSEYPYDVQAKNAHYTIGIPPFYPDCDYADEWASELKRVQVPTWA
jgi:hypothetical protein